MKCKFCTTRALRTGNKTGLCSGCNLAILKNNLKALVDIYLKRKNSEILRRNLKLIKGNIK